MSSLFTGSAVEFVAPEVVRPLRHRVLRPHQALEATQYPGDDAPDSRHAAIIRREEVIAVASVYRQAPPGVDDDPAWRLRGMAVASAWQGHGAGGALIEALVDYLEEKQASYLWCNARESAISFYERMGFRAEGLLFDEPPLGPHRFMRRIVSP